MDNVKVFKALGDETRLMIVGYLVGNQCCACDFTSMAKKDQTTVSRHLKVLVEAGILSYEKKGRNVIYKIKDKDVKKMLEKMGITAGKSCCPATSKRKRKKR